MDELITLLSGIDLKPNEYNNSHEGIPYITGASNFNNGEVIENRWTESPKRISDQGDLLFTCKGTVGQIAFNPFARAHIARQVMAVKPINYDTMGYIKITLSAQVKRIENAARGVIPGIERSTILNGLVSVPPLAEQERIVGRVDEIMSLLDKALN